MNRLKWFLPLLLVAGCATAPSVDGVLSRSLEVEGGKAAWSQVTSVRQQGEASFGGLEGPFNTLEDVANGRYRTEFKLGPYTGAEGFNGERPWFVDPSGDAVWQDAAADLESANNQAWLAARGYWFPERHAARMTLQGREQRDGRDYDVIEAVPENGRPMTLWFDAESGQLARIHEYNGTAMQELVLDDYRRVDDVWLPFHSSKLDTGTGQVTEQQVTDAELNVPLDAAGFELPEGGANDVDWPPGAQQIELPFELVNNHIYIDVQVNGKGPLHFLVDTGGMNVLTSAAAERVGVEAEGALKARGTGEKTMDIAVAKVEHLSLGDLDVRDQTFFVGDFSELQDVEGVAFDGLVGFEVFRRFVVRIDYADSRLVLYRPEAFTYAGEGTRVPIRLNERTPEVDGSIDGIEGVFSIDTGSRSPVDLHGPFIAKHDLVSRYCPCVETVTGWGVGGPGRGRIARGETLMLGGQAIHDAGLELTSQEAGAYTDTYLAGNVGGAVLKRFNVIFDYSRNEMILERHARTDVPDQADKSGLWINRDGEGLAIVAVAPGSPAEKAGLAPGDRIVRVDGTTAAEVALPALRERMRAADEGTSVRFDIERDGKPRTVSVSLENFTE